MYSGVVSNLLEQYSACKAVIISGLHGDEPAGNEAAKCFRGIEGIAVIRNINKTGKRRDGRVDLNRQFGRGNNKTDRILDVIKRKSPGVVISLHEDYDGEGVYVYCSSELSGLLKDILPKLNVTLVKSAYGDRAENGVITNSKDPYPGTLEQALDRMNIKHCTIETPTKWGYEERADIHRKIVSAIVKKLNS